MDIYILLNDKKIGPFSEDATQTLLRQGTVVAETLAWRPGLTGWLPLSEVLIATSTDEGNQTPPESLKAKKADPASPKQLAFLHFFDVKTPPDLSGPAAEELTDQVTADPANEERLTLWKSERLRLHPELFPEELQAKKADRVQYFLELCQTAGKDYFTGVTKAHCQVLVAFLDVKSPRWDAHEPEAIEHHFFPAIAEKFPQVVNKQWKGHFQYREGAPFAGAVHKSPTTKLTRPPVSPFAAIFRGIALGLVILAVLYVIHRTMQRGKDHVILPTPISAKLA